MSRPGRHGAPRIASLPPPSPGDAPDREIPLPFPGREGLGTFLLAVVEEVEREGGVACLAGGMVRDLLLGLPGKDADLVVAGMAPALLASVVARWPGRLPGVLKAIRAGRHFPVHRLRVAGEEELVDLSAAEDGLREDGARRDFTVDALYLRLERLGDALRGIVVDHHGGLGDLSRRRLRATGSPEERFREDPARILRLVRLCASLEGFRPEGATLRAARRLAPELLPSLPGERAWPEIERAVATDPARGCSLLAATGALSALLPPSAGREGEAARTLGRRLGRLRSSCAGPVPRPLFCASLLLLVPPPEREAAGRRLALPGLLEALRLCADAEALLRPDPAEPHPLAATEALLLRGRDPSLLPLLLGSLGREGRRGAGALARVARLAARRPPLLAGRALLRLGVPPGPRLGELLSALREEELRGRVGSREAALAWISCRGS